MEVDVKATSLQVYCLRGELLFTFHILGVLENDGSFRENDSVI